MHRGHLAISLFTLLAACGGAATSGDTTPTAPVPRATLGEHVAQILGAPESMHGPRMGKIAKDLASPPPLPADKLLDSASAAEDPAVAVAATITGYGLGSMRFQSATADRVCFLHQMVSKGESDKELVEHLTQYWPTERPILLMAIDDLKQFDGVAAGPTFPGATVFDESKVQDQNLATYHDHGHSRVSLFVHVTLCAPRPAITDATNYLVVHQYVPYGRDDMPEFGEPKGFGHDTVLIWQLHKDVPRATESTKPTEGHQVGPTAPEPPAMAVTADYKKGDKVNVDWKGKSYPATILKVSGKGKFLIHYDGYTSSWDETITPDRILSRR